MIFCLVSYFYQKIIALQVQPPQCPTKTDSICRAGHFPLALNMQQLQKFDGSRVHQFHPTWSTTLYNIYTPSQNNIIMHSKYSHKLHVLGNVFVKLISLTERLPHHILHQDMPVSRSTASQKEQGFLLLPWLLNNIKSACRPLGVVLVL